MIYSKDRPAPLPMNKIEIEIGDIIKEPVDAIVNAANTKRPIAFPAISTGVYCFPLDRAARIAIKTVKDNLTGSLVEKVIFVCFNQANYDAYM